MGDYKAYYTVCRGLKKQLLIIYSQVLTDPLKGLSIRRLRVRVPAGINRTQCPQASIDGYVQGFPETTFLKPAPPPTEKLHIEHA